MFKSFNTEEITKFAGGIAKTGLEFGAAVLGTISGELEKLATRFEAAPEAEPEAAAPAAKEAAPAADAAPAATEGAS